MRSAIEIHAVCRVRPRRLTLPSSGPAYGGPLKSNVRALSMNSLRRSSSLPRRVFVHGLVVPLHRCSCQSRESCLCLTLRPRTVLLIRLQGCGQKPELAIALQSVARHVGVPRKNPASQVLHRRVAGMLLYQSNGHLVFQQA